MVGGVLVAVLAVGGCGTADGDQAAPVTRTELGRGTAGGDYTVTGAGGRDVVVQKVTIEAGASAAWHTRPGAETAVITAGTLTFFDGDDPDCAPRPVHAGQVVVGSGHVHQGRNLGQEPVQIVVTYYDVPVGGPAATPAERPSHCPE